MKRLFLVITAIVCGYNSFYAQQLVGKVVEMKGNTAEPLFGANVYWLNTTKGTTTTETGEFSIEKTAKTTKLVISFIGYETDTIETKEKTKVFVALKSSKELNQIDIVVEQTSSYIDYLNPRNTEVMKEKELFKAACCNLSESFETNPSVDVSFTDAVTGTKQIQMLGLAGIYTQITTENYPGVRGLSSNYGLTYIPGSWINSIQITKGIGSVVNGYESVAGQINVDLKKPIDYDEDKDYDKVFLNGYLNESGRAEFNAVLNSKINDYWATTTLFHASTRPLAMDQNNDSFMDNPTGEQLNFVNRWKYFKNNTLFHVGVKGLIDNKLGGQFGSMNPKYLVGIGQKRGELFFKRGYVFEGKPYKTIGLIGSGSLLQINSEFGNRTYDATQKSIYSNLIYQTIIKTTDNQIKVGTSFIYDNYNEQIKIDSSFGFNRTEIVPGIFSEYTYCNQKQFSAILGARLDYHNLIGLMFNPRMHLKYHPKEDITIRLTSGTGQRVANVFSENMASFASSRSVQIIGNGSTTMYGLDAEKALNNGISVVKDFKIDYHKGTFTLDYYRTDFINQVVVDYDFSPQALVFYNLKGKSYSNSFQAEVKYEPFKRFETRFAYRFYDVKTKYMPGWLTNPLISKHRGFANLAYQTRSKWSFDLTAVWNGIKRIPTTVQNPIEYRLPSHTPNFVIMNAQISKNINKLHDFYIGVENLTNYRQKSPIIGSNDPFGKYFDSSLVWGPIFGRMIYGGFRIRFKNNVEKEES